MNKRPTSIDRVPYIPTSAAIDYAQKSLGDVSVKPEFLPCQEELVTLEKTRAGKEGAHGILNGEMKNCARAIGLRRQAIALEAWETDPWTIDAILQVEPLIGHVLDPAAGDGRLALAARTRGHSITAIDKILWRSDLSIIQADFFDYSLDNIISAKSSVFVNPPFQSAQKFLEKILEKNFAKVIAYQRFAFLESYQRFPFFAQYPPSKIWFCGSRSDRHLITTPPSERRSRQQAGAFFIWEKGRRPEAPGILYKNDNLNFHKE